MQIQDVVVFADETASESSQSLADLVKENNDEANHATGYYADQREYRRAKVSTGRGTNSGRRDTKIAAYRT